MEGSLIQAPAHEPVRVYSALDMPAPRGRRAISQRFAPLGLGPIGGVPHVKSSAATVSPLTIWGAAVLQWVRADTSVTVATGVSSWLDLSGNGLSYSQGTAAQQPALNATDATFNNKPTITLDGSNDNLQSSLNLPASGTTPTCALLIAKLGTFASQGIVLGQSGNTGNQCMISTVSSTVVESFSPSTIVGAYVVGSWYRFRADYSNAVGDIFRVGSAQNTGNAGNQTAQSGRCIGGFSTASFCQAMTIWEVVYLNIIPTGPQVAAFDSYAATYTGATFAT